MPTGIVAKIASLGTFGKALIGSDKTKIGDLVINCTEALVVDFTNEITEHPVEFGYSITDHVYSKPLKVKVSGLMGDTPMNLLDYAKNTVNLFRGNVFSNLSNRLLGGRGQNEITGYEVLRDMYNNKVVFDLVCKFDVYKNMVIEHLNIPADPSTSSVFKFEVTLKQIVIAQASSIALSSRNVKKLGSKVGLGRQELNDASAIEKSATNKSLLKMLL